MKYYAIKRGKVSGVIVGTWKECQEATSGYSKPDFKGFDDKEAAQAYLEGKDLYQSKVEEDIKDGYIVAFCDGSFDNKYKRYGYGVLIIDNKMQEYEICGSSNNEKYVETQNIAGEVLGVIKALEWMFSNSYEKIKIYHDYEGLSKWVTGEWEAKTEVAKMYISVLNNKFSDILDINFEKVKGHSNNSYNDKADLLARKALHSSERIPVMGDSWYVIPFFKQDELVAVLDLIREEFPDINITHLDSEKSTIYKLKFGRNKLNINFYKSGARKLLVQGENNVLFQIFTTTVNELIGFNVESVFSTTYKVSIDKGKIDKSMCDICPIFPVDYPESVKRLIRQSIMNLNYCVECEEYSQYVFCVLRALEGHMKYLFNKEGIAISRTFDCFNLDAESGNYILPYDLSLDSGLKKKLEKYYNFYHVNRHTLFHFGDILGAADNTRVIETKKESDELIKKTLKFICEE